MIEQLLQVPTADGVAEAVLIRPDSSEPLPAVINLTDGLGFRQTFVEQSKRIAERGYVVLTPNIFYRTSKLPVFDFQPDFGNDRTRERFKELSTPLTPHAMARDGASYVNFLASHDFVSTGPMAVVGFCFSGKFALEVAASRPDRIAAVASFHGGGLFTDTAQSPHLVLPRVKARLYFGHATKDSSMNSEQIEKLEWALSSWGGSYESEVYPARHGWMIPGREVHDPAAAERGFQKLTELLDGTVKAVVADARPSTTRQQRVDTAQTSHESPAAGSV